VIAATGVLAVFATGAAAVVGGAAARAVPVAPAAQSVLTLRTDGDHDALWLLQPDGGEAKAAGVLPGVAQQVAVSPDGATVAYLPAMGRPFVWIGYGPAAVKTISLRGAGVRTVTGMTWVSADELLVSGSKKAGDADGYNDRLYTVDVTRGTVTPFRNLAGTQPDAAPVTGQIVYVQFKKLDSGSARNDHTPRYRESLKLTTLTASGSGRTLGSREYRPLAYYRAWAAPQLAPGGKWIVAGELGSDVRVTYNIYCVDTDYWIPWLTTLQPTPMAMAWSPVGPVVAFGGAVTGLDSSTSCVYVADVTAGSLLRSSPELINKASAFWVMDIAWSDGDRFVVDAFDQNASTLDDEMRVLVIDAGDLTKTTELGVGHLSVWVR
jgi:hypothetical protein